MSHMPRRWEQLLLWLMVAACGAVLFSYNLGLYGGEQVDSILGSLVGLGLLAFGIAGLRNEYRRG